jgi:hypothetical protein
VTKKVFLGKKWVYDIGERRGKYGNRMYSCHCDGKWLMDFHGSLLIFLFYLKYERNIKREVHTRII